MLQQTSSNTRNLFLELFTQELINNSKAGIEKEEKQKKEEEEKIIKIKEPEVEKPEKKEKEEEAEEIGSRYLPSSKITPIDIIPKARTKISLRQFRRKIPKIHTIHQTPQQTIARPTLSSSPFPVRKRFTLPISTKDVPQRFTISAPSAIPIREDREIIDIGKLNLFLTDKAITMIECPGPHKFVLIKKAGKVNLTKIILTQEEIDKIIENFSKAARIPLIGGVFKASTGKLTISAILSEFVGSRFIIYKASPYSIIEQPSVPQQTQQEMQI